MRIAFFTDAYYPDLNGVTVSVVNYAHMLREKGHTVYIFAPKKIASEVSGREKDEPYVYRLPSVKILSSEPEVLMPLAIPYKSFIRLLRTEFDVIHAHGNGFSSLLGHEVAMTLGVPFVMTFHTLHTEYTHYFMQGKVIRPAMVAKIFQFWANHCDGVIVPSEKMKQKLIAFGCEKAINVVPNFIETKRFSHEKKGYVHKKLRLPMDTPLILTVGRIGREKNFTFLIEAFAKLAEREVSSHVVFVGQGPEKQRLKKLAKQLGIAGRVHFIGVIAQKYMPHVYADASIFVFPSTSETQGMCVLEAAASGLPIVVAKDMAYQDMVEDGRNGYILPLDPTLFAEKIYEILKDPVLQKKFSRYSTHLVEQNFDAGKLTDTLISFYTQRLTSKKIQAKIIHHVNTVTTKGVRSIRRTQLFTVQALLKLMPR